MLFGRSLVLCLIVYVCFTGESGVVYCGYLESGGGRDVIAAKTCKGMKY